jgi:hypothetical protein
MAAPVAQRVVCCPRPLPGDFVLEVIRPEDGVKEDLQVVTHRRVAVQVEGPGRLEDPAQLDKARGHVHDYAKASFSPISVRKAISASVTFNGSSPAETYRSYCCSVAGVQRHVSSNACIWAATSPAAEVLPKITL